jgi:hypothetical protein
MKPDQSHHCHHFPRGRSPGMHGQRPHPCPRCGPVPNGDSPRSERVRAATARRSAIGLGSLIHRRSALSLFQKRPSYQSIFEAGSLAGSNNPMHRTIAARRSAWRVHPFMPSPGLCRLVHQNGRARLWALSLLLWAIGNEAIGRQRSTL